MQGWAAKKRYQLAGCLLLLELSAKTFGQSYPGDHNLREACRKQVAGHYLSLYDQNRKNKELADYLQQKTQKLTQALEVEQSKLKKLEQELRKDSFDVVKNRAKDALTEKIKALVEALNSEKELRQKALSESAKAKNMLQTFKARLAPVFKIETLQGHSEGYKFKVDYRLACPPYRYSCPLSRSEAQQLRSLFEGGPIPEVCAKYADFMQWG